MRKQYFSVMVFCLCLLSLAGCGLLFGPVLVENKDLDRAQVIDPNSGDISVSVTKKENGDISYKVNSIKGASADLGAKTPFRIPYYSSASSKQAVVECTINDKSYPALLDSGASTSAILVTQTHVNENQLPMYFFKMPDGTTYKKAGLALIDDFQIGQSHFHKFPTICRHEFEETQFLGLLAFSEDKEVIVPLGIMKAYRYILFDNINQEVEFSTSAIFSPDDETKWETFRMNVVDDRLLVNIPIIDEEIPLILDTGGGVDFVAKQSFFEKIRQQNPQAKNFANFNKKVFFPFMDGKQECRKYPMHNLKIGGHMMDVDMFVFEDGPEGLFNMSEGLIGFPFLKKTVFVLDFKNHLLWVKKAKGSRFEK